MLESVDLAARRRRLEEGNLDHLQVVDKAVIPALGRERIDRVHQRRQGGDAKDEGRNGVDPTDFSEQRRCSAPGRIVNAGAGIGGCELR